MKRGTIVLIVVGALLLLLIGSAWTAFNRMGRLDEEVTTQWAQVENVYQRRMDLIPNIVAVAKKYGEFEKSTLEAVINARANATRVQISPENLDEESLQKFESAQNNVGAALGRLMMITEQYPDLKTSGKFDALIVELEGSENRIARERQVFNDRVKDYNQSIRRFPANIWAGMFGFDRKGAFKAKAGADTAPDVEKLMD